MKLVTLLVSYLCAATALEAHAQILFPPDGGDRDCNTVIDSADLYDYVEEFKQLNALSDLTWSELRAAIDSYVEITNNAPGGTLCPDAEPCNGCGGNGFPCSQLYASASTLSHRERGLLPTAQELDDLEIDTDPDFEDPCPPPEPEDPFDGGGPGPFYCSGVDCTPPTVTGLPGGPGGLLIYCVSDSATPCEYPTDYEDITEPPDSELDIEDLPLNPGDDKDPAWGPDMYPPGEPPESDSGSHGGGGRDCAEEPIDENDVCPTSTSSSTTNSDDCEDEDETCDEGCTAGCSDADPCGGDEGDSGGNVVSSAPVHMYTGAKIERAIDLSVRVTGPDFRLTREYSSDPGSSGTSIIGEGWTISSVRYLIDRSDQFPTFELVVAGSSASQQTVYKKVTADRFEPGGPTDSRIERAYYYDGSQWLAVWRQIVPGHGETDFYRQPQQGETEPSTNQPVASIAPGLVGAVLETRDQHGNARRYDYLLFGANSTIRRLGEIVINEDASGVPEAIIRFTWYLIANDPSDPMHGDLARVQVIRVNADSSEFETQRVEYTYKNDIDPFVDDVGTEGDLIQVTKYVRVDAQEADGSTFEPGYPAKVSITQYRYHDGSAPTLTLDQRLDTCGGAHQLKMVIHSEQLEYASQRLFLNKNMAYPSVNFRDGAYRLMKMWDDDRAFAVGSTTYDLVDLATKIVGYDTYAVPGRVESQYLQSDCGCGGSGQALKLQFAYSDWDIDYGGTIKQGRSTSIEEYLFDGSAYSQLYRTTYYDNAPRSATSDVPYLFTKAVVAASDGRAWATHFKYDASGNRIETWTPAAMVDATDGTNTGYTPAIGGQPPLIPTSTPGGLIKRYAFNSDNRPTEYSVADGSSDPGVLVDRITWGQDGVTGERPWLRKRYESFAVEGSSAADDTITRAYSYTFHGATDAISSIRVAGEAELPEEGGPSIASGGGALENPGASFGVVENGAVWYVRYKLYDDRGRLRWVRREDNTLIRRDYEPVLREGTGRPVAIAVNADPTADLSATNYPGVDQYADVVLSNWGMKPGGGRITGGELERTYERDRIGRITARTTPGGVTTYVYREYRTLDHLTINPRPDLYHYVRTTFPPALSDGTTAGPAVVKALNTGGKRIALATYEVDATGTYPGADPPSLFTNELGRTLNYYSLAGLLLDSYRYHDLDPSAAGYVTHFEYDELGRMTRVVQPNGAVTAFEGPGGIGSGYDERDRVINVRKGTDGDSASFADVASLYYDDPDLDSVPEQGVGNGNLSWSVEYIGELATPNDPLITAVDHRSVMRVHDARDRIIAVHNPEAPHAAIEYDNLDRPVSMGLFGGPPTSSPPIDSADRGLYGEIAYGQSGRAISRSIAIAAQNLGLGFLESGMWYDERGRVCALERPGGPGLKVERDGHGRPTRTFVTDRLDDLRVSAAGSFETAASVTDDRIIEQFEYSYAADGPLEFTTQRLRHHDYDGLGALDGTTAVPVYMGLQYDEADRPIRTVTFGTNTTDFSSGGDDPYSGASPVWPPASATPVTASMFPSAIVTGVEYNTRGLPGTIIDPLERETKLFYDGLNRRIAVVENADQYAGIGWDQTADRWLASGLSPSDPTLNHTTSFVYDGVGNLIKQIAHLHNGSTETAQITEYVYGTAGNTGTGTLDSLIGLPGLLREIRYPLESTGQPASSSDTEYIVTFAYNRQGEVRTARDQNQTVHVFDRDLRGRVLADRIDTFGTADIDQAIEEIRASFDDYGRLSRVLSLDGTGTAENAVGVIYNSLWNITQLQQDHDSDLNASGDPTQAVQYSYLTLAAGATPYGTDGATNFTRVTAMYYPHNYILFPTYGTGTTTWGTLGDRISRTDSIIGYDGTVDSVVFDRVVYRYLGLDRFAVADFAGYSVQLDRTLAHDGTRNVAGPHNPSGQSGNYPGWDRFGRLARQVWADSNLTTGDPGYPSRPPIFEEEYAHDLTSNLTRRADARPGEAPGLDDADFQYTYDDLNRLISSQRGTWDGANFTTPAAWPGSEGWQLDALGNWDEHDWYYRPFDVYSYFDMSATRGHNSANELTAQTPKPSTSDAPWTMSFGPTGNLEEMTSTLTGVVDSRYTYDAWNRLVKVEKDAGSGWVVVGRYEYNGLGWRTVKESDTTMGTPDGVDERREMYYDASWRLIQEDIDTDLDGTTDRVAQLVWGERYIDDVMFRLIDDDPAAATPQIDRRYLVATDRQFSPVAVLDEDGDIVERKMFEAYGRVRHSVAHDVDGDGDCDSDDVDLVSTDILAVPPGGLSADLYISGSKYASAHDFDRGGQLNTSDISAMQLSAALPFGWISDPSGPDLPIGYSGYVFNNESGLYTVRHRDYSPDLGRWAQRDPLGYVDGMSMYQYVVSRATRFIDPSGLDFEGDPLEDVIEGDITSSVGIGSGTTDFVFSISEGVLFDAAKKGPVNAETGRLLRLAEGAGHIAKGAAGIGIVMDATDALHEVVSEGDTMRGAADAAEAVAGVAGLALAAAEAPAAAAAVAGCAVGVAIGQLIVDEFGDDIAQAIYLGPAAKASMIKTCAGLKKSYNIGNPVTGQPYSATQRCNMQKSWKHNGCQGNIKD